MSHVIFVYGTLKRGQRSHHILRDQVFIAETRTQTIYRLYDTGSHPALVDDREKGIAVRGEVWQVNDETLRKLDEYEEAPDYFSRRTIQLQGWESEVQAYFFNGDVSRLKDCGDRWPREVMIENRT